MNELAPFLPGFAAAYAILLVAASSPGPAVAMLLGIGLDRGRGPALFATAGIAVGSAVLNVGTLVGVGLILREAAWAMTALRLLGAAYLLWLSWRAFRTAARGTELRAAAVPFRSNARCFAMGMLLQTTNPKAIVFWLAIAAVGATEGGGALVVAAFVAGAFAISFACHAAWAVLLSSAPVRAAYARARRRVETVLGAFFAYAAVRMALYRP